MAPITRSQSHYVGEMSKFVLEHPPVIFTITNVLKDQNMHKEACNLKLLFKSKTIVEVINKCLAENRYAHDYESAMRDRVKRFIAVTSENMLRVNQSPKRRTRTKCMFNLLEHIIANKDIVDLPMFKTFKKTIHEKIIELSADPRVSERMSKILLEFDWST